MTVFKSKHMESYDALVGRTSPRLKATAGSPNLLESSAISSKALLKEAGPRPKAKSKTAEMSAQVDAGR